MTTIGSLTRLLQILTNYNHENKNFIVCFTSYRIICLSESFCRPELQHKSVAVVVGCIAICDMRFLSLFVSFAYSLENHSMILRNCVSISIFPLQFQTLQQLLLIHRRFAFEAEEQYSGMRRREPVSLTKNQPWRLQKSWEPANTRVWFRSRICCRWPPVI